MTSRRKVLCSFVLVWLSISTSSVCRGQDRAAQPPNASPPAANQADVEAAVGLLCKPADIIRSKNGNASGCKSCPEGTDFFGQNMGEWELRNSLSGHFTSAQDNDLIVGGFDCDSHANNFGGSFIFSLKSGKPRLLRYDSGLLIDQCRKFRYADGREFLVCRGGWTGMGENVSSVFLARFDSAAKDTETTVFTTTDTSGMCDDDSTRKVDETRILDIRFSSKESGEMTGVTLSATSGKITCAQANAKINAGTQGKPGSETPSVKTYELHYNFDGKRFTIAPESKAALKAFPR